MAIGKGYDKGPQKAVTDAKRALQLELKADLSLTDRLLGEKGEPGMEDLLPKSTAPPRDYSVSAAYLTKPASEEDRQLAELIKTGRVTL